MARTNRSFDIRAEHPKRVHVDRQMKKIRMKETARNQLPDLESDGTLELPYNEMANGPEREPGQEPWARYRFQRKNSDVYTDQQSCESPHKNSLTTCAYFHTKITKGRDGQECYGNLRVRIAQLIIAARGARDSAAKELHWRMQSHCPGSFIVNGVGKN